MWSRATAGGMSPHSSLDATTPLRRHTLPDTLLTKQYNNMYKCKVTGKTNKYAVLTKPVPPTEDCENAPDKCTSGPKQPMYMWQKT